MKQNKEPGPTIWQRIDDSSWYLRILLGVLVLGLANRGLGALGVDGGVAAVASFVVLLIVLYAIHAAADEEE